MKILVVGAGAREHALVWKVSQSDLVDKIFAFPGNAGIEQIAEIPEIKSDTPESITEFAVNEKIDLTIVGPEQYLADGIVDLFEDKGLKIFGVNKKAAQLESSKAFAKDMMRTASIPTAKYFTVDNIEEGKKILRSMPYPLVIKADGLAAGKGVSIVQDPEEAESELSSMLQGKFSDAGKKVVIEEFLVGEELSLILFVDGNSVKPLQFSQDHKAAYEGDKGPNTGGMGAYTPVGFVTDELQEKIDKDIISPLLKEFKNQEIDYRGVLYIGLMVVNGVPYVLEYNVRFGDPETEPLLYNLKSDIVPYMLASIDGTLDDLSGFESYPGYAACVVMASGGYPGNYEKGKAITGVDSIDESSFVFHAGTKKGEGDPVTKGGRVLMVTSRDDTIKGALEKVYNNIDKIKFDGSFFRKDIGHRELSRK